MKNQRIHIARFLIILAMALIGVYTSLQPIRTAGADSAKAATLPSAPLPVRSTLHGPAAIKHLEQTGLDSSLSAAMTAARYRIEERKAGGYEASNPKQDYRTVFTRAGVEVSGAGRNGSNWRLGMKLIGYGYGQRKQAVTFAAVKAKNDRIEYERRAPDGRSISEWYVNRVNGLEQGFTIPHAPVKRKAGERLNLWLELSGDLKARLAESGQAILLNGRAAGPGLRYDHLHAFDATGRELEARMKLSGGQVRLEVVDELAIYPVTIDPTLAQEAKLTASDAAAGDRFGFTVAISGETAVVSAQSDDTAAGTDAGSAYVFVRNGISWSQQAKLTASDAAAGDKFGEWVAISGDTIVVGASRDSDAGIFSGSAYVFVRSGISWSQQAKLTADDAAAAELFGFSVGISGETVVVGAVSDNTAAGPNAGSAYVFVRSGTSWSQQQKLTASDAAAGDSFGFSVSIEGDTVVVGAPEDDDGGIESGSAYVFVRSGTSWSQQAKLIASDTAGGDQFGRNAVSISGDTIVVGAPFDDPGAGSNAGSAYVFVRSGTSWSQQQKLTASDAAAGEIFGISVGISGDTVVVGVLFDDDGGSGSGSAHVFVRSGTTWSQQQKLTASDAAAGDNFGFSVSIEGDTVVVGAFLDDDGGTDSGSAYVFEPPNQAPDCSGASPSISGIWPPNHDMIDVTIQGVTDPDGDPVTINIDQIKQDESTDGPGDGHTCPDGDGIGTSTAQVRAERSAAVGSNGRVYTIYFTASDGKGGTCQGSVTVCVPRTRNGSCTDDGPDFDSTECESALNLDIL